MASEITPLEDAGARARAAGMLEVLRSEGCRYISGSSGFMIEISIGLA